jgi:hypothetical protein
MKRIIPFSLYLLLVIPVGLFAKTYSLTSDTSSNSSAIPKSIILRGNLSSFNASYGRNYFELNWNTVAGDFDHFEIERSLDGTKYETIGTVNNTTSASEGQFNFRDLLSAQTN